MTKRFMLMLYINASAGPGHIRFVPRGRSAPPEFVPDFAAAQVISAPGKPFVRLPALSVNYGQDMRIVSVKIRRARMHLGERFQSGDEEAEFPVYMTVDYNTEVARIAFRERRVDVTFDKGYSRAAVTVRELPADCVGIVGMGEVTFEHDAKGKLTAIAIADISKQLPTCYLAPRLTGM